MSQSFVAPGSASRARSRGSRRPRSFKEDTDVSLLREALTPGSRAPATPRHATPRTPVTRSRPLRLDTSGTPHVSQSILGSLAGTGIPNDRPRSNGRSSAVPNSASRSVFDGLRSGDDSRRLPASPLNEERCVTVFGFPANFADDVYRYFAKNDPVRKYAKAGTSALHLEFESVDAANRALQRSGSSHIVKGSFLGIVPCKDQKFISGSGQATAMSAGGMSTAAVMTRGGGSLGPGAGSKPSARGRLPSCCLCCSPAERDAAIGSRRRQGWLGWLARLQDVLCSM